MQLQSVDRVFLFFSVYHIDFPGILTNIISPEAYIFKNYHNYRVALTFRRYSVRNTKRPAGCFRTPRNCTILGWRSFAHKVNSFRKLSLEERADNSYRIKINKIQVAHITQELTSLFYSKRWKHGLF